MPQHFNSCPRRIVCLRHRHRTGVACDVHDPAIREPFKQLRYVSDIDRKLNTRPVAPAEPGNLVNQNSGDRPEASVRLLDSARDFSLQHGVASLLDVFESPESAVQSRQLVFGKAKLDHFIDILIARQITNLSCEKITKILTPPVAKEAWVGQPHNLRAHRNDIMPERTSSPMEAHYEYVRFHRAVFSGYLNAYHCALNVNSRAFTLSGINPFSPLCSPRRSATSPLRVNGT